MYLHLSERRRLIYPRASFSDVGEYLRDEVRDRTGCLFLFELTADFSLPLLFRTRSSRQVLCCLVYLRFGLAIVDLQRVVILLYRLLASICATKRAALKPDRLFSRGLIGSNRTWTVRPSRPVSNEMTLVAGAGGAKSERHLSRRKFDRSELSGPDENGLRSGKISGVTGPW